MYSSDCIKRIPRKYTYAIEIQIATPIQKQEEMRRVKRTELNFLII